MMKYLADRGADPLEIDDNGRTLIHHSDSGINQMSFLLDCGVDIDAIDVNGQTALHMAVERDNFNKISSLLSRECDMKIRDRQGKTALDLALQRPHQFTAQLLREAEARAAAAAKVS